MANTENVSAVPIRTFLPTKSIYIAKDTHINVDANDAAITYLFNMIHETTTIKHR
jgi:hypothetical protein